MDIQIPEMLGEEALRINRVKDKVTGCQVSAIALTAFISKEDRWEYLDQDFDGCLSKPLETRRWRRGAAGGGHSKGITHGAR